MDASKGPNELWADVIHWYGEKVGKPLNETPGIWSGTIDRLNEMGPFDIAINAHKEPNDDIPPFGVRITSPVYLFACIVTPSGGEMAVAGNITEDALIDFFEQHTQARAKADPTQ